MLKSHSAKNPSGHDTVTLARELRDCIACGIIALNGEGKIIGFNAEAETMTGLISTRILHQSADKLPPALQPLAADALAGKTSLTRDIHLQGNSAEKADVRVQISVSNDAQGNVSGVVLVLNDLGFTRKFAQSLRRLDRLANVGTLSASMTHEVKNALVAVKTFVDLLLERDPNSDLAPVVRREMSRIDGLVSHLLKFANPTKTSFREVRVHEVIEHALRLVQHQIDSQAIALHRAFDATTDLVSGNEYHLEQAFINLLLNAVEAMGPNGKLQVSTTFMESKTGQSQTSRPCICVSIQDNGVGIDEDNMQRLFEPFFTTKKDGTGLGLSITRRIVEEHSGEVQVRSQPNQGTTFSVLIPLQGQS